ncbi:hypothetical protein LCGC14_2023050 [marine sediment metagenome]|uniref:Uncharacterized protein n=1 Tax=marine sediment metagenome TaxID=412755 RepID=A0A0F9EX39_9ZZZZ
MNNPLETATQALNTSFQTMMAQSQAFVQNIATTFFNGVQGMSSSLQRAQNTMAGGVESMMSTFATQAAMPMLTVQQMAAGVTQGAQQPSGAYEQFATPQSTETEQLAAATQGAESPIQHGGPGGQWSGQDRAVAEAPAWQQSFGDLRETENYKPLTEDRRKYYDARYGGGGFSASKRAGEIDDGNPRRTTIF